MSETELLKLGFKETESTSGIRRLEFKLSPSVSITTWGSSEDEVPDWEGIQVLRNGSYVSTVLL